ncbi:MAG: MerR family transcriptional regulator [Bacteroidota bacterium]
MAVYSISDLAKLSGIKPHTIRAWENRYGLISPRRTPTNIRYYEDEDLKKLLGIALLKRNGLRISKIAKMTEMERAEKISSFGSVSFHAETQLDALTLSMVELDEYKFAHILRANIDQIGFEATMLEVIYPFLDKLSLLWLTGSLVPAQESFISQLIRQKINSAIDQLPPPSPTGGPTVLIYLRKSEQQELTALFVHYLMRKRGIRSIYLGPEQDLTDLVDAYRLTKAPYIFTILSQPEGGVPADDYIDQLLRHLSETKLLLTGYQAVLYRMPNKEDRIKVIGSLADGIKYFDELAEG